MLTLGYAYVDGARFMFQDLFYFSSFHCISACSSHSELSIAY